MQPIRRVWVTRAEPGATRTAEVLMALGYEPVVQPLLAIRFLTPPLDLDGVDALAFTSRNGVAAFAALTPDRHWPVVAVGDATAFAAKEAGFVSIASAAGNVDALAALISDSHPPVSNILHVSAAITAGDLSSMVSDGIVVRTLIAYEAVETGCATPWGFDAVLVHSPRAARLLAASLTPELARRSRVVAISDAAARPLESIGFAETLVATHPNDASLMAALGKLGSRV